MATASLLKPNQLLLSSRRQYFHSNPCSIKSTNFNIVNRRFHSFKVKSFSDSTSSTSTNKNNTAAFPYNFGAKTNGSIPKGNIHEGVTTVILKTLRWLKAPAVVILLLFLTMYGRDPALAARSGGAMGGSSFSSSSKSSSSSSRPSSSSTSSSYSSRRPSSSSTSPSYSSWGPSSSSTSSSDSSWRPSSSSTSSSSSSSWPSSSSTSSSPSWSHESSPPRQYSSSASYRDSSKSSSSWSSPARSSSYPTSISSPAWTAYKRSIYGLNQGVTKESVNWEIPLTDEEAEKLFKQIVTLVFGLLTSFFLRVMFNNWVEMRQNRTRVIKLQVGRHVRGPSFAKSIKRIAVLADTSTLSGLIYILKETTEVLRTHFPSVIAVNSSVKVNNSIEEAEEYFKKLSLEEREKYDNETLVNLDDIKGENTSDQKDNMPGDTYMVVTILVAAKGKAVLNFPTTITANEDLKKALDELQTISKSAEVQAVNVVWTPDDENEVMSREELYQVYPLLREI